jgi:hypothetical protein
MGVFFFAVRYPTVQTWLAQRATDVLSHSLGTKVSIERVEISFFNKADLVNFYMEDKRSDTLIYARELKIEFKVFDLFNRQVNVSRIFLDKGTLHLYRDSTGKLLNLTEVFKNFAANKRTTDTTAKKFNWDLNLQELQMRQTDFSYQDDKSHTVANVFVPSLLLKLENISIQKKLLAVHSLKIDSADVQLDLLKREKNPEDDSLLVVHFLPDSFKITFDEFALTHSRFRMNDHNSDTILPTGMDFKHLDVSQINLIATNGSAVADTVLAHVEQLTAKEKSGFELEETKAEARFSVNEITFSKLQMKTANSTIKNYLSLRYRAFHDFKDFTNAVRLRANFDGTTISLKDLNYFVRNLDKVQHNKVALNGEIDGRINSLKGRGLELRTGQNTIFKGDFYTHGLPNIFETSLNIHVGRLATTADDVRRFYPQLKLPENLNKLGLIYYTGSLDGFATDFVSSGKLVTSIGSATTDVNFKYNKEKNKAAYEGNLSLYEFDLGKYFDAENILGKVSLQTKINGRGITLESLQASVSGKISDINFNGYDYRSIEMNGVVFKKSFNGTLSMHDEFLDMDFNGKADLTKQTPEFNFEANVRKAFLQKLNLTKDDLRIAGKMKSDFKGSSADDLQGSVALSSITLWRDTIDSKIKNFNLDVKQLVENRKEIKLNSDFAEGELDGNFSFNDLPHSLLAFAKYTFTKDYADTISEKNPQNLNFDLRIYEPGNFTRIIHPLFYKLNSAHLKGSYNSSEHQLNFSASIPEIAFGNFTVRRADVDVKAINGVFNFQTSIDKVYSGDSLLLDTVNLLANRHGENFDVNVMVADKHRFNYADITAYITPLKEKSVVRLDTSDVKLGNYNWHFKPDNFIYVDGKKITTHNLVFKTNDQTVFIDSYLKNDTSTSVKVTLDNTDIGDFTGVFTEKMKDLKGAMNGKLVVEDIFAKPLVYSDVVINDFTLGKELIGDIDLESRLDESGKKINLYASIKSVNNFLEANGYVSLEGKTPTLKIDADATRLGINFLNYKFFDKYVKDCRGYAQVHATIAGPLNKPLLTGYVDLINDTVSVSFLNTTYHIQKHRVILDEHGFDVGNITLYDVKDNVIYGNGRINHESFRNFALDLYVNTPNAQFLNTNAKLNPNFYGVAYGAGKVSFVGDVNSPVIKAYAKTTPGTYCSLPINSSFEINRYGFYRFLNPSGKNDLKDNRKKPELKLNGVNFILELEATPDARMDIVLDPVAGDVLTSYGRGNLKIEIPKVGTTTIYGTYEIDHGNYLFTLQNVINKRFEINKGGTINFTGDAYKAALNVDAVYEVRSSVSDLVDDLINNGNAVQGSGSASQNQLSAVARSRIPIRLFLNLTGVLEKPNVAFNIQAVDPDPVIKSYVDQKLALLKTNENELNKQVFGLLVMNRFLPSTNSTTAVNSTSNYVSGTAANTVSEFLSSQLSNYLSNLFGYTGNNALQNLDINIGYRQYDQLSTQANSATGATPYDTRRELQLALQQRLLNNRLTINAGGNLDFGNSTVVDNPYSSTGQQTGARTVIPTGDFQIQYALTPDGRWSAKAFNRTNYDYLNSRNTNRTGIGLSYRQEFDKPSELFQKFKKNRKKKDANVSLQK